MTTPAFLDPFGPRAVRPSRRRPSGIVAAALAGALAALAGHATAPEPLVANGGTLRVADVPVGAYRVSVYTDPTPPRPDSLDISVLVVRAGDPRPVPGLSVGIQANFDLEPSGRTRSRILEATRDQADDPRYYAAKFAPGFEGRWTIVVGVAGPEGEGEVTFDLDVRAPGLLESPWVVLVLALLPLGAVAWWLTRDTDDEDGAEKAAGTTDTAAS